jgi:dsRNA-specific ribonuclease
MAAIYLDKNLSVVETFAKVVLFPRIFKAIAEREWLDPKTKLQQTVLSVTKNRMFSPQYKYVIKHEIY